MPNWPNISWTISEFLVIAVYEGEPMQGLVITSENDNPSMFDLSFKC